VGLDARLSKDSKRELAHVMVAATFKAKGINAETFRVAFRSETSRSGADEQPRPPKSAKKAPRIGGAARGEVGGPREIATQRCDSATPSFIPPLNAKGRPESRPSPLAGSTVLLCRSDRLLFRLIVIVGIGSIDRFFQRLRHAIELPITDVYFPFRHARQGFHVIDDFVE
jgi:hypothetical protein